MTEGRQRIGHYVFVLSRAEPGLAVRVLFVVATPLRYNDKQQSYTGLFP